MRTKTTIAMAAGLLGWILPAGAREPLYTGEVTGENVNVLSRFEDYVCTRVSAPTRVQVYGTYRLWLEIGPVPGCYSVVAKQTVDPRPDGRTGVINGQNVWVRAGGDLRGEKFHMIQVSLNKGDEVGILGTVGDYYRIVPPEGATWWIAEKYVKRVDPTARTTEPGTGTPGTEAPKGTDTRAGEQGAEAGTSETGEDTVARIDPELTEEVRKAWRAAEEALKAEYTKPLEERDFAALLARYEAIEVPEQSPIHPWVRYRIRFLNSLIRQKRELQELDELVEKSAADQQRLRELRGKILLGGGAGDEPPPSDYAIEGVLKASLIYTGKGGQPKRYLVHDPDTHKLTAFAQCTTGEVDLDDYVGMHVGLFGAKRFDKTLQLNLVEALQVNVIDENPALPEPRRTRVRQPVPAAPEGSGGGEDDPAPVRPVRPNFGSDEEPIPETGLPVAPDDGTDEA